MLAIRKCALELAIGMACWRGAFAQPAPAAPEGPPPQEAEEGWRFDLALWLWAMGIDGDVGVAGQSVSLDESFIDLIDESDSLIGIAGRSEVGKGRWAGYVDGLYNRIGVDDASGPLGLADVDLTVNMALVDFGLMYRLTAAPIDAKNPRPMSLEAYVGGRYVNLEVKADPAGAPSEERDPDWIDPIFGLKVIAPLSEHWRVTAWGDIGGFGVESDFTSAVTAMLGYDFTIFTLGASVFAGYRVITQDFSEGSGSDRFVWDVTLHGPLLGFELSF